MANEIEDHVSIVLIAEDGRVIIQRRDNITTIKYPGRCALPGGRVESGETPLEAAIRELREETGIEVANLEFLRKKREVFPNSTRADLWIYWGRYDRNQPIQSLEGQMFLAHPDEFRKLKALPGEKAVATSALKQANIGLKNVKEEIGN